jgi:hypothetical protein
MNLLLDDESTPEISCDAAPRSTLMSGLVVHAVLFTALMAVQVGMVAQALAPHTATAVQTA